MSRIEMVVASTVVFIFRHSKNASHQRTALYAWWFPLIFPPPKNPFFKWLWTMEMVFWCLMSFDVPHCFELIWWVFRFQLSQKRRHVGFQGDTSRGTLWKKPEKTTRIIQNVFYARIMRGSIPESKAIISGSYKARSWMEVGSVKLFTHIVGNKFLLIGNVLHTFQRSLRWRDGT